ncbi:hypothetical protein IMG5_076790 [Ichthyophthirius multifiliis]|uniref:SEC7 domain-containing protein n=1 Tax=Ichthyophthirius multifiliis TaxID=5932 RepID=G0QQC5_ICHMU|nr:hypothetical protein IMG5_076790 [Ichthyophthirius multifiliis]EGR32576.1 hypothetical protein IMG5_076790 [Ichthyophthirius multifiliis]|eukprot:XP_004036562.1 hypothetical protein IMG5_076790 [Ichthyophthirius multifiliis]
MDQFLKEFMDNPQQAIQFLIDKNLCDNTPEDIAYMLLTTEGINKQQLGQYFGKNNEKNQLILEAFCSLLDFRELKFDQAIRMFLSRFKLPGESQQIDRIVQKFTKVYTLDNPGVFTDQDVPYILCYSAIMLNVDAHSNKIEKKYKMTKEKFTQNNLACTRNAISKEFLGELYDNIVKEKFETKIDYIEQINRISIDELKNQDIQQLVCFLQGGVNMLKYGRKGKPHMRKIFLSQNLEKIIWMECDFVYNNNNNKKGRRERFILVKDLKDICLGAGSTEVMRRNNIPEEFDQFCLSIIASQRSLDLKANDVQTLFKWVFYIYHVLNEKREAKIKK